MLADGIGQSYQALSVAGRGTQLGADPPQTIRNGHAERPTNRRCACRTYAIYHDRRATRLDQPTGDPMDW